MECFSDNLLFCIFTIVFVEFGEPRFAVVIEYEDGFDHGVRIKGQSSRYEGQSVLDCGVTVTLTRSLIVLLPAST